MAILAWSLIMLNGGWRTMLDNGSPWALAVFALLMIFLPMVGFPISVFYVCAGVAFSPWQSIPVGLVCLAINMSASYLLARYCWREPLREKISRRWPQVFSLNEGSALRLTILVRAIPGIPFWMQNYILGVLAVPFAAYLALSWTIQGCFLVGVALTANGAITQDGQLALWGGFVVLVTMLGIRVTFRRRHADLTQSEASTT